MGSSLCKVKASNVVVSSRAMLVPKKNSSYLMLTRVQQKFKRAVFFCMCCFQDAHAPDFKVTKQPAASGKSSHEVAAVFDGLHDKMITSVERWGQ